jgi:hypothetical protein
MLGIIKTSKTNRVVFNEICPGWLVTYQRETSSIKQRKTTAYLISIQCGI